MSGIIKILGIAVILLGLITLIILYAPENVRSRLIGDAVIFSVMSILIKRMMHNDALNLEKQKRRDYFVCRNYSRMAEGIERLSQIARYAYDVAVLAERTKKKTIPDLWRNKVDIIYNGRTEKTSFHDLFMEYHLYFDPTIMLKSLDFIDYYNNSQYSIAAETILKIPDMLEKELRSDESRAEHKRIFDEETKLSKVFDRFPKK